MRLAACALSAVLLSGCSWLGTGGQAGHSGMHGAYGAGCAPAQQGGIYDAGYGYGDAGCAGGAYGVQGAGFAGQGYGGQGFAGQGYGAQGFGGQGYGAGQYGATQYAGVQGYGAQGFGGTGYGGVGGQGVAGQGFGGAAYGAPGFNGQGFGGQGFGAPGFGGQGYGAQGFGGQGFGTSGIAPSLAAQGIGGAGFGGAQAIGPNGLRGAFGPGGVTTLGAGAPYGAAAFGGNVVGTQLAGGQYVNGAYVQNVQGAPIYVPQPYAAPYGVPQGIRVGAPMPFGFEAFGGTDFDIGGDIVRGKPSTPASGGGGDATQFDTSYDDAFDQSQTYGGAMTYDLNRSTTLLGQVAYSKADGQAFDNGTFTPTGGSEQTVSGQFGDLEQVRLEGGLRKYVGNNYGFRPYVGATGGFVHNNNVNVDREFTDSSGAVVTTDTLNYIDAGWQPTAAGIIGAEMAVGNRAALGVETGIRWTDSLDTLAASDDRISVPVKLRGRVSF